MHTEAERINAFPTGKFIIDWRCDVVELPKRKNIRLPNFDYGSFGAYFITICTKHRKKILSDIVRDDIHNIKLTKLGEIVNNSILDIGTHYQNVKIDKYVIMPDHIHLIIRITGLTERINPFPTGIKCDMPNIIGKFKAGVTRNVGKALMPSEKKANIWQAGYYDHVIRNQTDYNEIWEYIENNPKKWIEKNQIYK